MTLRLRILALVLLFALFLIAGFAAIQITQQFDTLNTYNAYRVRVGSHAAKTSLAVVLAIRQALHPADDPAPALQEELRRLQGVGLFDEAAILTPEGTPVAATPGASALVDDVRGTQEALTLYPAQWHYTRVASTAVHAYVPIAAPHEPPQYVARFTCALANVRQAVARVYRLSGLMVLGVLGASVLFARFLTRAILQPIQVLNEATRDIAAGNLALKVHVDTGDELEELAGAVNDMTDALVRLRAKAEDANPLTKLPGNRAIQEAIERRIAGKQLFVAVYADLDHFKAFNDHYGIGAGDEAIKLTAKVLQDALKRGNPSDFLGHEGGDDFVLLTTPDKVEAVTRVICAEFDQRIRALYTPEDAARGKILATDREGKPREFPLMTLSLAGVTNAHRPITAYAEVTGIFSEVKLRAKRMSQESAASSFALDRRRAGPGRTLPPRG
ncbi:MAG: diguanylate cyclase [Candidatus Omnitrophica bacterium]|nr:diguanylate cyclase [Candidatus Omnitrophota bacterium]